MRFHCRIPGFKFTAYQPGRDELPKAVPPEALRRKVGPGFRDVERTVEVEVARTDGGKPRLERQTTRSRERIARVTEGRAVLREVLEVEARDEIEAEAIYRRAVGIRPEGTSRAVEVTPAEELVGAGVPAGATEPRRLTAEEEARRLVGGHVPKEE